MLDSRRARAGVIGLGLLALLAGFLLAHDAPAVAVLGACFVVMGLFSLYLPYGELTPVDGALSATAIVLVGPAPALLLTVGGRVVASGLVSKGTIREALPSIAFRGVAIVIAGLPLVVFETLSTVSVPLVAQALAVSTLLTGTEFLLSQAHGARSLGRSYRSLLAGNAVLLAPLFAAEVSSAVLAVMLFPEMQSWSLLLVLLLLLLIRQSYSMLFEIRGAYRRTVEVLVDAAESMGATRHGHAEATARNAHDIAIALGLRGQDLERVVYAALLHDIDLVGGIGSTARSAGRVLEEVRYLANVVPILRVCDGDLSAIQMANEDILEAAFIVSLSSDVDCIRHGEDVAKGPYIPTPAPIKGKVTGAAVSLGMPIPSMP